jgi:hypothetical protein
MKMNEVIQEVVIRTLGVVCCWVKLLLVRRCLWDPLVMLGLGRFNRHPSVRRLCLAPQGPVGPSS